MEKIQGKRLFILPIVSLGLDQKIIENTVVKEKSTTVFWEKTKEHERQKKWKKKKRENWEFCQCYLGGKRKCGSGQDTMKLQLPGNITVCFGLGFPVKCLFSSRRRGNSSLLPVCGFGSTPSKGNAQPELLLWNPGGRRASVSQFCCVNDMKLPSQ